MDKLDELEKKRAEAIERQSELDKKVEDAKEALAKAQEDYADKLRDYQKKMDNLEQYGYFNPNHAQAGERRRRSGAAANNEDWGNWGNFAKPEGWDQRYWQTHPGEAAAAGVNPGMNSNQQSRYNQLANKMANGGLNALSDSEKAEWNQLKQLDPEEQKKKMEEAIKDAEKDLKQQKQQTLTDAMKAAMTNAQNWTQMGQEIDRITKKYYVAN